MKIIFKTLIILLFVFNTHSLSAESNQTEVYYGKQVLAYDNELEPAMQQLKQLPEFNNLAFHVLNDGGVHIVVNKNPQALFNAMWEASKRVIYVNLTNQESLGSQICSILFEMHNAASTKRFVSLIALARQGKIDKNTFVESVEKMEFNNALNTCRLLKKGVQKGIFPQQALWPIYENFEDHYKLQQLHGHSHFIANTYDKYNKKGENQAFEGTIPHLNHLSQEEKQHLLYYLALKTFLESSKPHDAAVAQQILIRELCKKDFNKNSNNCSESCLQVVFKNNPTYQEAIQKKMQIERSAKKAAA